MKKILLCIFSVISITIFGQVKVSKNQAIEDINFFNKTLQEVHYNPFLFIDNKKYFNEVDELKQSIGDSIEIKEFIFKLYHLTSLIKDSHTSPGLMQTGLINDLKSNKFFPYLLVRKNNKLYFSISTSQKLFVESGSELISINNNEIKMLLNDFDHCIGGTNEFSVEMTIRLFPYFLFLKGILPPYKIVYRDSLKVKHTLSINEGMTFKNALISTLPSLSKPYKFEIVDNKLGFLHFASMSEDINVFDHYLDSCVTLMKSKNIINWAIDIRDNSGGNSMLADVLISYFNKTSYSLMGKRQWKISQQYKNYLISSGDTTNEYLSKRNGTVWELGNCEPQKPQFENNNVFNGKVFLITGPFTFSSANMFADGVKKYKLAKVVGDNTGENTNDFGEVYSFELPNSKIKMQTTTSYDLGTDCEQKKYEPVKPDEIIETPLINKINEEDYVLKKILEEIK